MVDSRYARQGVVPLDNPGFAGSDSPMVKFNLGVDLSFAKKRWPEPEAWLEIVKDKLDLRCVEFDSDFLDPLYISEPTRSEIALEIRRLADEYGVVIHNYFTGAMTHSVNLLSHPDERVRKDGIRWCEEAIKVSAQLGSKGIGGHFDTISSRDLQDAVRYKMLIDNLICSFQHLAEIARRERQEFILWEQMYAPSEVPYTIDQTQELIDRVNAGASVPIHPVLDLGHCCCQNYPHAPQDRDPYQWLRRFGRISPVIHVQQTNATESCHWPFTEEFNRTGIVRREKVLEALRASGADEVLLVLEIFFSLGKSDEQILNEMRESVDYWREVV